MRAWIRTVGALVAGLLAVGATSAAAIVGGLPDGTQHPNVGMIVGSDDTGRSRLICTGTLVTPTVVLTAAHCVQPVISPGPGHLNYRITFDTQVVLDSTGFPETPADGIPGRPDPDPDYVWALPGGGTAAFNANTEQDLGLLYLSAPAAVSFPGIQPAPIVGENALEPFSNGGPKPDVLEVGYGDNRVGPPGQGSSYFIDGFRNQALFPLSGVKDGLLFAQSNPNDAHGYGGVGAGDSGGPWFMGGAVVSVLSGQLSSNNKATGARLDAGPGREFLRSRNLVP